MVKDAVVMWPYKTPDVDLILDPRVGFDGKETVKVMYVFNLLGITKPEDMLNMLKSFYDVLAPDGQLYIIEHDFEYFRKE